MATLEEVMAKMGEELPKVIAGQEEAKKQNEQIQKSMTDFGSRLEKLEKAPVYPAGVSSAAQVLKAGGSDLGSAPNVPAAIVGEMPMTSRPFSFQRLFRAMAEPERYAEQAKVELGIYERLKKSLIQQSQYFTTAGDNYTGLNVHSAARYREVGGRIIRAEERFPALKSQTVLAPLSSACMPEDICGREFIAEMKSVCQLDWRRADLHEQAWVIQKSWASQGYDMPIQKVMSWLDSTVGGSIIKPAEQGEIIELLRNKEALSRAGARTIPMPAQGRIVFPRIASPTTAAAVVESTTISSSDLGTGTLVLSPKKIGAIVKMPNELLRYTSQAAESVVRDDLTKTLALTMDLYALEGQGGNDRPLGLINYDNINTITSTNPGTNGDTISPQDPYLHIAAVEEKNAEFEGFIMRPQALMRFFMYRFATIQANDQQGGFAFDITRGQGMKPVEILAGYPVTKSAQVSRSQTKGGGTGLTYILGGQFSDFYLAMFGAIEFAVSTQGDTAFGQDQTWIRAIITGDSGPRHEAAFSYQANLIF